MNSPADDLGNYLESKGHGTRRAASGWCISVGTMPDNPVTHIALYDTGGREPDTDEQDIFYPTVQVRVRAPTYPVAYAKINAIMLDLIRASSMTLGGTYYASIDAESDILSLGKNERDQDELTLNLRAMRQ